VVLVVAVWTTVADLATAGGTLVLAVATFASVRSANRAARAAERSMLAGLRPLLLPSRLGDPPEKVGFTDDHWVHVPGGEGTAEVSDTAIYLTMAVRNVGTGLAVLDSWFAVPERLGGEAPHPDPRLFRHLTRDLYLPAGDRAFWQGAFRDPADPDFVAVAKVINARQPFTIFVLYGDGEGGQRMITRFAMLPGPDKWLVVASRHWNLDRANPR
jgi:hypothetical protein